ncbi:MAG: CoA-binding protein [Candidatus Dormibacteraeota bacterium]|nr:CoA-binding protein [Candidatus Dormibacteraeota bacterium]
MTAEDKAVRMLGAARTIAVVGMSANPAKAAHRVPAELVAAGWHVIPVNPNADTVLGLHAYDRLDEIDEHVDLVDVFRPARDAPEVTRQAVAIGAGGVWLQLGIVSAEARAIAEGAGLDYVENICINVVRQVWRVTPPSSPPPPPAS